MMETRKSMKAALVLYAEASVLWNAALGDVQVAENLDAGDDRRVPLFGDWLHGVLQDAVNAVLHSDLGIARFDRGCHWRGAPEQ